MDVQNNVNKLISLIRPIEEKYIRVDKIFLLVICLWMPLVLLHAQINLSIEKNRSNNVNYIKVHIANSSDEDIWFWYRNKSMADNYSRITFRYYFGNQCLGTHESIYRTKEMTSNYKTDHFKLKKGASEDFLYNIDQIQTIVNASKAAKIKITCFMYVTGDSTGKNYRINKTIEFPYSRAN